MDMDNCYEKTSEGDIVLRNRRPHLRSGLDDADAVESLRVIFSKDSE